MRFINGNNGCAVMDMPIQMEFEGTQKALDGEQEEERERVREEEREAVKKRNQTKRGYQRVNPICV